MKCILNFFLLYIFLSVIAIYDTDLYYINSTNYIKHFIYRKIIIQNYKINININLYLNKYINLLK